jgi:spore germination protein GerM
MSVSMRRLVFVAVGLVVIALALFAQQWFDRSQQSQPLPVAPDSAETSVRSVALWFASPEGDSLVLEPRDLAEQTELHARVAALVAALEGGPRGDLARTLPEGTSLLHAYLDETGLLTLDLSLAFRQGFRGGARVEELVVGSLVRTVSANVPEAKRIRIVCGGAAFSSLGGHFPLDRPIDPDDWP